jgi:hypothetical protein
MVLPAHLIELTDLVPASPLILLERNQRVLQLRVVTAEDFDETTSSFVPAVEITLRLEHSLVSLSKWESKWEIPFLTKTPHTREQVLDYIVMMNLDEEFPEDLLNRLDDDHITKINEYIEAKMTATKIRNVSNKPSNEIVTAEIIYYWMIAMNIPFECQHWHLARLLALIQVVNAKNAPPKKMSAAAAATERQRLNAERRAATGSKG